MSGVPGVTVIPSIWPLTAEKVLLSPNPLIRLSAGSRPVNPRRQPQVACTPGISRPGLAHLAGITAISLWLKPALGLADLTAAKNYSTSHGVEVGGGGEGGGGSIGPGIGHQAE